MKKRLYTLLFIVLGILLQFLAHALLEVWYIGLLLEDFDKYGFGFSWATWVLVHNIGTIVFFFAGIGFGFWQGRYWWPKLYNEEGRMRRPKFWQV